MYRSSPQLLKLFRTEFNALAAGYREGDRIFHYLPPRPVKIHSFVYECDNEEIKEFSGSFDFLNIIINSNLPVPVEEILAASLRRMSQVYDEVWLEGMVNEMGGLRRSGGFDYFAGGFLWIVAPSRDRFEMTEDTRYVVNPETEEVVALICVNPIGNQRTLSGVFKATREGVVFHDFKTLNYISGMTAEDLIEGRLPKPATGNYYAVMPLLYGVEVAPGNFRLGWYVPVYWYEDSGEFDDDETVYLAGFAIVDAQDTNKIALTINEEGITSEQMVRQTRIDFIKLFGSGEETNVELTADVLNSYSYVQDGLTHIVLRLDNKTYPWIEATPTSLSVNEWNQLMAVEQGQEIFAVIEKSEDKWIIAQFENQG